MIDDALREVLAADPRIAYALLFGDVDVAIGLTPGTSMTADDAADIGAALVLDDAPPRVAFEIFRDGQLFVEKDRAVRVDRQTRAIVDYLDFKPIEDLCAVGSVDTIANAVQRIREILPADADGLRANRTVRDAVTLNLFVATQQCATLASHFLISAGSALPSTYGAIFLALADRNVIPRDLAERLGKVTGFRNLTGDVDPVRLFAIATTAPDDLLAFCALP